MQAPIQTRQIDKYIDRQIVSDISFRIVIIVLCLLRFDTSLAAKGDELVITKSLVNVRSGPSSETESILKLKKDRKVTEIQRQKGWVEVELGRDDFVSGWIHNSLITKVAKLKNKILLTRFDKFLQRFNDHNDVLKKQNDTIHFTKAINKGKGDIDLIATNAWLNSNIEKRNNSLNEIFNLWSKFVPVGSSISVQVLDEQGEKYTVMMR